MPAPELLAAIVATASIAVVGTILWRARRRERDAELVRREPGAMPSDDIWFDPPAAIARRETVRGPADIIVSARDRIAAGPVREHEALQHVTAEALRHASGREAPAYRSPVDQADAKPLQGGFRRQWTNYFARHWHGELSLPVSYWINGSLAGIAIGAITAGITVIADFKNEFQPDIALAAATGSLLVTLLITPWQLIGIWRSATNYQKAMKVFWGTVAKVTVVLSAALTVTEVATVNLPQLKELYNIYRGDQEMGGYAFRVLRGGRELEFSGGIAFGAAKDFQRFLDAMGIVEVVHLNSPGGRITEAERIGRLLQERNLSTYVAHDCLSACTHIFLSGRQRLISPEAHLGFHQPDAPGLTVQERLDAIAAEEAWLRQRGLSAAFARKAVMAPPSNMWFPSASELIAERVATRLVDPGDFALSGAQLSDITPDKIGDALLAAPMYVKIRQFYPDQFARLERNAEEGLKAGVSSTELANSLRPLVREISLDMLPYASDTEILDFVRMEITNASKIKNAHSPDCYFFLRQDAASKSELAAMTESYKAEADEEISFIQRLIENFNGKIVPIPDEKTISPTRRKLVSAIGWIYSERVGVIDRDAAPEERLLYCAIFTSLYSEALKLPQKEAVAFLRYAFANSQRSL